MSKLIMLAICLIIGSGVLFVNFYNSLVDAKNWSSNMPASIEAARAYFKTANAGNFFRIFSPLNQLAGILLIIICWKAGPSIRWTCITAFLLAFAAEGLTFKYFFPRNDIIFLKEPMDVAAAMKAVKEWARMNWLRTILVLLEVLAYVRVMILLYKR